MPDMIEHIIILFMPVQNQSNLNYNILGYNCKQLQYKEKQENDKSRDSTYPEGRRGQPSG